MGCSLGAMNCSPFGPKRFTNPPSPLSNSTMLPGMVRLYSLSVYHCANVSADLMQARFPSEVGLPSASSVSSTKPSSKLQVGPGKSVFTVSSLKSRNRPGTLSTQASSICSQLPRPSATQLKPSSSVHSLEQPSPSRKLPSSHSSSSTIPSPQLEVHGCPLSHLGSAWQRSVQPSNGMSLPSSQLSAPSVTPSPQVVGVQVLGDPSHLNPTSMRHFASQPSP